MIPDDLIIFDTSVFYVQCMTENLKKEKIFSEISYYYSIEETKKEFEKRSAAHVLLVQNFVLLDEILELIAILQEINPSVRIAIIGNHNSLTEIRKLFEVGVVAYLEKSSDFSELKEALVAMQKGKNFVCNTVKTRMLEDLIFQEDLNENTNESLTNREIEVTRLICEGLSSKMISEKLFISVNTVETHRKNILLKLNVKNSLGIMKYAMKNNLLK